MLYGQSLGGAVAIYLADKHQDEVIPPPTHIHTPIGGLANDNQVDALIVENTFTDMPTIARKSVPQSSVSRMVIVLTRIVFLSLGIPGLYYLAPLLCSEKWRSINLMPKITRIPLLFLAGELDEVIPHIHMTQLWETTERAPVRSKSPTFRRSR